MSSTSTTKKTKAAAKTKSASAAPEKAAEPKTAAAPESVAVVYCGPTIKNGPHQFTVYTNGVPDDVRAIISRYPIAGNLVVPVSEFAKVKSELRDPDSPAGMIYRNLYNNLKGGQK